MDEYEEIRQDLEEASGSPFIINAILSTEDETASYREIKSYVENYPLISEEELPRKIDNLVASGIVSVQNAELGENTAKEDLRYKLTEKGLEFLNEDLADFEAYRKSLKFWS